MCIFCVLLFGVAPLANAAGSGGGGSNCGYISYQEWCDATHESTRDKCSTMRGGGNEDCTLKNCDGTIVVITGRPNAC